jgi:hypothetical protein
VGLQHRLIDVRKIILMVAFEGNDSPCLVPERPLCIKPENC